MSRNIAPFGVRMPSELKEALEQSAKNNKRSLNAEVVDRLQETLRQDKWQQKGLGYGEMITIAEEAISEGELWQSQYKREYSADRFDAMKDEILHAIYSIKSNKDN